MFCPKCRTELPEDTKYCIRCGYDFTRIKTPPPEQKSSIFDRLRTSPKPDEPKTPSDSGETLKEGEVFARRYRILSDGKRGGMGVVYKCEDQKLNRTVALKIIHPRLLSSEQAIKRFRQEVSISLELLHRNIVRVHNLDEYEGIEFFTMEWVEGKSLREILNERVKEKQPFNLEEAYTIISQLSDALQYAHQHTIHRDIKPENILVIESKEGLQVKLTDFGIAKMLTPAQFATTSLQIGTPYYMAPEQKVDAAHVDKRADIYAVGVMLFELLTLENTIGLEMPSEINQDLPKEIDQIIKRAVATKPENRYGDVKELSEGLGNVVKIWRQRVEEERKRAEELRKKEEERLRRGAEETKRKREEEEWRKKEEEEKKRKIQSLLDEGKVLLYNNKLDNAIKTFEKLLQMDSENEEGRELLDRAKSEKRRLEELRRREEEEKRKEDQRKRDEEERIRKEVEEKKRTEEAKEKALWLIEKGKESESAGKYQEALNYFREAGRISSDVLVIGPISELTKKIKEEEEKKREEEEHRKKEEKEKKLSAYKRKKKVIIELVSILIIIACGLSLYGYNIWQQKQFNKFVAEAEQLLDQKKYPEAWKKVEDASWYGSKEKSEKLASLIEKLEDYREALKSKDGMEKAKATLDIDVIKKLNLEGNHEILISEETKAAKAFELDKFKEAKDLFEKTRINYTSLIDKIAELQKTEQQRIEELKKAALKTRDEMEGAKKGINIELAKQYAGKEYQFSISQEQNGIRAYESGKYKEAKDYFETAKARYLELPDMTVRLERAEKGALKVKDEMESTKKKVDIQLAQRYAGREYNDLVSQEKKGIEAFRSGQFKEAKDIFEVVKVKYSDLPDRIAKLRKAEEERVEKERFEKLKQDAAKARSDAESARSNVDMKLVEKFGFKQEYNKLLSQESKGKEAFEANNYIEAKDIYEKVRTGYATLADKTIGLKKDEEDRVERERTERLRQEAIRLKDDAERAKLNIDLRMVERYGFREEYRRAVIDEENGKKVFASGNFQQALEIFEKTKNAYDGLKKESIGSRFRVEVDPSSINFGQVHCFSGWSSDMVGPTQRITIRNTGSTGISIKNVKVEGEAIMVMDFRRNRRRVEGKYQCEVGRIIPPGEYCVIDNEFIPRRPGFISMNLIILFDDPNETRFNVQLQGQGLQPLPQRRR